MPTSPHARTALCLLGLAMTASLTAAPAHAAGPVAYRGTEAADKIDFRNSGTSYSISGLGGNDTIYSGYRNDTVDGGKGKDTIDPMSGDDVVRGGPDGDYFRYGGSFDGIRGFSGFDTICDFAKGDKIDVYTSFLDGEGHDQSVGGGNFKLFDTNKDGVIDNKDKFSTVKKVKTCGKSKDALVLDIHGAFEDPDDASSGEPATLTVYGKTSLKKSDFVNDYFHDYPY